MKKQFTVGDLREMISHVDSETRLFIDGGLTISRIRQFGRDELRMEFVEVEASLSDNFQKKYPTIAAVFCRDSEDEAYRPTL